MTGYEKSPDYGGGEVTKREIAVWFIVFAIVTAICVYLIFG